VTSSVKHEVHNVSQRRQGRTEPQPEAAYVQNLVKFGHAVFTLDRQTDKQTYSSQYFTPHLGRGKIFIDL